MGVSSLKILIAGAGAVGLALALRLAKAGHRVTVADPAASGDNASGVAAGMLAPAFEALFDEAAERFDLLCEARDLWPELAGDIGLTLMREGALGVGSAEKVRDWTGRLAAMGAEPVVLGAAEAAERAPGLAEGLHGVQTAADWRLEPDAALAALRRAAVAAGAEFHSVRVLGFAEGVAQLGGGARLEADVLVIATGAEQGLADLAPELGALSPIKGHILRAPGLVRSGPTVRGAGVYVCASQGGALIGATMESGRDDTAIDAAVVADLLRRVEEIIPNLSAATVTAAAGVRGATADGWPLVGPRRTPDVFLAVGARRNGWLLAPMMARVLEQRLSGAPADALSRLFDPARPGL